MTWEKDLGTLYFTAMKEDKENTRPKEKRVEIKCEDGEKTERPKEKKEALTKVKVAKLMLLPAISGSDSFQSAFIILVMFVILSIFITLNRLYKDDELIFTWQQPTLKQTKFAVGCILIDLI